MALPPATRVIRFPSEDEAFSRYVDACLARASHLGRFQALLAAWYPEATAVSQSALGTFGVPGWYVYRDARARNDHEGAWWEDPDVACVQFDASATILGATAGAAAIAGRPSRALVGVPWSELAPPDVAAHATDWIWNTLLEDGVVRSTARIRRPDGTETSIEYRSTILDKGRFRSCWREVRVGEDGAYADGAGRP